MLGEGSIAWCSMKQPVIAQSTTESELIAANEASKEGVWLRRLLNSFGIKQKEPTEIFCDNQPTIRVIKNPIDHKRTKHVDIRFLYIRERINVKEVQVTYINTKD
jgi:hypothetical protein